MKTLGIIAEYNPLHNGHLYHLNKAKELSSADNIIVTMSGNFVQRGEPSILGKYDRALWAIQAGADLVLETPTPYSIVSAQQFAYGNIRTLLNTGVITHISFGCETPDCSLLIEAMSILNSENTEFKHFLKEHLKNGESYPRARFGALSDLHINQEILDVVNKPNNILAMEYIRVIQKLAPDVILVPVKRTSDNHNSDSIVDCYPSSTAIRNKLTEKNILLDNVVPEFVAESINDKKTITTFNMFSDMIFYSFLKMSKEDISRLYDVSEGLENVIYKAVRNCGSLDSFLNELKSKRYTLSRCKRILLYGLLNITKEDIQEENFPNYIHPLACKDKKLLSEVCTKGKASVLMKKQDYDALDSRNKKYSDIDLFANEVYSSVCKNVCRKDYLGPIFV